MSKDFYEILGVAKTAPDRPVRILKQIEQSGDVCRSSRPDNGLINILRPISVDRFNVAS